MKIHFFTMSSKKRYWGFHETTGRSSKSTYEHLMDFENFMRSLRGDQNKAISTWWILEAIKELMKIHFFTMSSKRRFGAFDESSERSSKSTYEHLMDFEDFMGSLRGAQNRPMSTWWILRISWDHWEELKIDLWALDGFWGFHETTGRSSKSTYEHLMDFRGDQRG